MKISLSVTVCSFRRPHVSLTASMETMVRMPPKGLAINVPVCNLMFESTLKWRLRWMRNVKGYRLNEYYLGSWRSVHFANITSSGSEGKKIPHGKKTFWKPYKNRLIFNLLAKSGCKFEHISASFIIACCHLWFNSIACNRTFKHLGDSCDKAEKRTAKEHLHCVLQHGRFKPSNRYCNVAFLGNYLHTRLQRNFF